MQGRKFNPQLDSLPRTARDDSLAPSDASEQMLVEYIEGGPLRILPTRVTRSHGMQR